jgi:hypothetical protein
MLANGAGNGRPSQKKRKGTHAEKDRRAVLAVASLVLKHLHDGEAGVETNTARTNMVSSTKGEQRKERTDKSASCRGPTAVRESRCGISTSLVVATLLM